MTQRPEDKNTEEEKEMRIDVFYGGKRRSQKRGTLETTGIITQKEPTGV